ncbi:MAG: hypothetical protein Q4B42_07395, partial [Oscillospiraceae bacterium]|nr:hypothetical protein [Oscillospiraceae bacterium]
VDEYYDIVVFGFLRAVRRYFEQPALRAYAFSTIAWRAMKSDLFSHYRAQGRRCRTISLSALVYDNNQEKLTIEGILSARDSLLSELETEWLLNEISALVSAQQMDIIRLKHTGYQDAEIANEKQLSVNRVQELLSAAYAVVKAVCD